MKKSTFYKTIFSSFKKHKLLITILLLLEFSSFVFGLIFPYFSAKLMQAISIVDLHAVLKFAFLLLVLDLIQQTMYFLRREKEISFEEGVRITSLNI